MPHSSLAAIDRLGLSLHAPIIDAGGGASRLGEEVLRRRHTDVTVADISARALDGPTRCSRLPVSRYGADELAATLGDRFRLVSSHLQEHRTPRGASQQFLFAELASR